MKDAQELLHKVDLDLNQKYGPDFKDKYQIELLLRELDVSGGHTKGLSAPLPAAPTWGWGGGVWSHLGPPPTAYRTRRRLWTSMSTWCGAWRSEGSRLYPSSTAGRRHSSPSLWRHSVTLRVTR